MGSIPLVQVSVLKGDKLRDEPLLLGELDKPARERSLVELELRAVIELHQRPVDLPDAGVIAGVQNVLPETTVAHRQPAKPWVLPLLGGRESLSHCWPQAKFRLSLATASS